MNMYDKNIIAIKKSHKYKNQFLDKLLTIDNKDKLLSIKSIDTKDGNKALVVDLIEKSFRLNSSFKPVEEATKWAEQFEFKNIGTVLIMFGFGNGIRVREILKRMKSDEKLIIYEPSVEIFMHVIEQYNIADIIEDIRVDLIVEDLNEIEFSIIYETNVKWQNLNSSLICIYPKYNEIFYENLKCFLKSIEDINLKIIANMNTMINSGELLTEHMIKNIKYISKSNTIDDLVNIFPEGMSAIIVSAGPSLNNNIEELKKAKGRVIIIAVDTALQHLLKKDILPDFSITIDPTKPPVYYNDERANIIPLLLESASNNEILKKHTGKKFFFTHHEHYIHLYRELGKEIPLLVTGGSVATSALAVCVFMGFKKIILVGQDLAYKGRDTHAGNVKDLDFSEVMNMVVEDIYGNLINTRHDWYYYLKWFNEAVEVIKKDDIEVIDATEGGAKIKGTKIMSLKEAIELYGIEKVDTNKIIDEIVFNINDKDIYSIKEYMTNNIKNLNIIKKTSQDAIEICNKLIDEYKKIDSESYLSSSYNKELNKLNKIIENCSVNNLLNNYISSIGIKQLSDIYVMSDNEQNNKIKTYLLAINFYETSIKGADDVKHMLNEAIQSF